MSVIYGYKHSLAMIPLSTFVVSVFAHVGTLGRVRRTTLKTTVLE